MTDAPDAVTSETPTSTVGVSLPPHDQAQDETAATPVPERVVLADRYELGELLGSGGMADVYRGTDTVLLRPVAVKLLRDVSDPTQRERFVAEAHTLASLNHPGLVTLLDAGIDDERPFLVMEMAEGLTLSQRLAGGPLPSDEVKAIGHQLAAALAYAHAKGVVHRDVKPSNVLLTEERPLLVDFGIARLIGSTDQHTRTGDAIGSPPYLAPEQVTGDPITAHADIFSFGLVLLEALTGTRAYTGTPVEAAVARLHAPPAIPMSVEPFWRSLLARMTDRDPLGRPTAADVADALAAPGAAAAAVVPIDLTGTFEAPVAPDPDPTRTFAAPERRRRRALPVLLTVLLAFGIAVAALLANRDPGQTVATDQEITIPDGVPAAMRTPLLALHRAVAAVSDREPRLDPLLVRVDAALSTRRFPAAATALENVVNAANQARDADRIKRTEALRITTPARTLLDLLPQDDTADPGGPASAEPDKTPRPRPTATASSGNQQPAAPAPTPTQPATSVPTTQPSPSAEPTDSASKATDPQTPAAIVQ